MPRAACQECGAEFYARSRVVASGGARFCSRECHNRASRRLEERSCLVCSGEFDRPPDTLPGEWQFHCCQQCLKWGVLTGEIKQCHHCGRRIYRRQADIRKSRSNLFFCDHSCRASWTNSLRAGENHPNWKQGGGAYRDILIRSGVRPVCERCRNEDPRVLAVHHLDQDRANNRLDNLVWMCHNCHHLIHHFLQEMDEFMATLATAASSSPSASRQ
jgi:hypothetical protein